MKILVVEDEPELRKSIMQFFYQDGHVVESAQDFAAGIDKSGGFDYDCVLVDITLPGGNGLEIIKELKKRSSRAGIIIISAKNSVDDKVAGLDLGADDYLSKPFHLTELNARVKALVRRKSFEGDKYVVFNEITIIPDQRKVSVKGQEVALTGKEYDLLLFFVSNKNRILSKSSIAEHLWGNDAASYDTHDFIYTHLKNLRRKLSEKGCSDYIHTIYGIGYSFKAE